MRRPGLIGDLSPLLAGGLGIVLGKRGADPGRDNTPLRLAGMSQALRMKCTRQRCQVALSTLVIAAFSPHGHRR